MNKEVEGMAKNQAKRGGNHYALPLSDGSRVVAVPRYAFVSVEKIHGREQEVLWWRDEDDVDGLTYYVSPTDDRHFKTAEGCLCEFYELWKAPAEKIREFAFTYGVLGLWPLRKFGRQAWSVEDGSQRMTIEGLPEGERPLIDDVTSEVIFLGDTVDFWHRMARRIRSILRIKASLDLNYSKARLNLNSKPEPPEEEDWQEVFGQSYKTSMKGWHPAGVWNSAKGQNYPQTEDGYARQCLYHAVRLWASKVPLTLIPSWSAGSNEPILQVTLPHAISHHEWHYDVYAKYRPGWGDSAQHEPLRSDRLYDDRSPNYPMRPSHLFHVLVLQLMEALRNNVVSCDKCGNPILGYKRNSKQRSLCDECRRKENSIRASASRRRRRTADRLYSVPLTSHVTLSLET